MRDNTLTAIEQGVAVVVGASGLSAQDFGDIDAVAHDAAVGVVAAGNFSLTAALAQAAALLAARHLPRWEIIDYASAAKQDTPSGTARELAERLAEVAAPRVGVSVDQTAGHVEARGATIGGTQVHSLRLPSFVVSTEIVFALPDERLVIRHDAGSTATPYVAGTLVGLTCPSPPRPRTEGQPPLPSMPVTRRVHQSSRSRSRSGGAPTRSAPSVGRGTDRVWRVDLYTARG